MIRYLNESELRTRLSLGKAVEQWLSIVELEDYTIIKWISITHERGQLYNVSYLEVFDDGDEEFTDVVEFSPVDPDLLSGIVTTFSSIDEMLQFVQDCYGASLDKFVSQGMIDQEYLGSFKSKS